MPFIGGDFLVPCLCKGVTNMREGGVLMKAQNMNFRDCDPRELTLKICQRNWKYP